MVTIPPVPGTVRKYLLLKSSDVSKMRQNIQIKSPNAEPIMLQVDEWPTFFLYDKNNN